MTTEQHETGAGQAAEHAKIRDEVDIEEWCAKDGGPVPKARVYVIRIDRTRYRVESSSLTGLELLALAGKTPQSHKLYFKPRGSKPEPVGPEESIDFRRPGIERFQTIPCDAKEGDDDPRRDFELLAEDLDALTRRGLTWEAVVEGAQRWLLIHEYPVIEGLTHRKVTAAFLLPDGYPDVQLDMVYVSPALTREDGRPITAIAQQQICGKVFQRWSRHRTPQNPWRIGLDSLDTHLLMVDEWFERERVAA